jgi:hypothetical protein
LECSEAGWPFAVRGTPLAGEPRTANGERFLL